MIRKRRLPDRTCWFNHFLGTLRWGGVRRAPGVEIGPWQVADTIGEPGRPAPRRDHDGDTTPMMARRSPRAATSLGRDPWRIQEEVRSVRHPTRLSGRLRSSCAAGFGLLVHRRRRVPAQDDRHRPHSRKRPSNSYHVQRRRRNSTYTSRGVKSDYERRLRDLSLSHRPPKKSPRFARPLPRPPYTGCRAAAPTTCFLRCS